MKYLTNQQLELSKIEKKIEIDGTDEELNDNVLDNVSPKREKINQLRSSGQSRNSIVKKGKS